MKNELEKHLLSRCHDEEKINELLETRYTFTGATKPSLVLLPAQADEEKQKSLLHTETVLDEKLQARKVNTRIEVREYLKNTRNAQDKAIRLLQDYDKKCEKKPGSKKPFPLPKILIKYQIPDYNDFVPMNKLWVEYIQNLIYPDMKDTSSKLPNKQMILSRLASAEYNGCLLTVLELRNSNLLGTKGIVVYDTQYTFVVCVPRQEGTPLQRIGGFRVIPKRCNLFSFEVPIPTTDEYLAFTLLGSRIEMRSVDRSTKKFKNHNVEDLI